MSHFPGDTVATFLRRVGLNQDEWPAKRSNLPLHTPFLRLASINALVEEGFSSMAAHVLYSTLQPKNKPTEEESQPSPSRTPHSPLYSLLLPDEDVVPLESSASDSSPLWGSQSTSPRLEMLNKEAPPMPLEPPMSMSFAVECAISTLVSCGIQVGQHFQSVKCSPRFVFDYSPTWVSQFTSAALTVMFQGRTPTLDEIISTPPPSVVMAAIPFPCYRKWGSNSHEALIYFLAMCPPLVAHCELIYILTSKMAQPLMASQNLLEELAYQDSLFRLGERLPLLKTLIFALHGAGFHSQVPPSHWRQFTNINPDVESPLGLMNSLFEVFAEESTNANNQETLCSHCIVTFSGEASSVLHLYLNNPRPYTNICTLTESHFNSISFPTTPDLHEDFHRSVETTDGLKKKWCQVAMFRLASNDPDPSVPPRYFLVNRHRTTTPMGKPEMVMMSDLGLMSFRDGMKFSHDLRACPSDLARWHGVSVDLIVRSLATHQPKYAQPHHPHPHHLHGHHQQGYSPYLPMYRHSIQQHSNSYYPY